MSPVPLCLEKWGGVIPQLLWERRPWMLASFNFILHVFSSGLSLVRCFDLAVHQLHYFILCFSTVFIAVNCFTIMKLSVRLVFAINVIATDEMWRRRR